MNVLTGDLADVDLDVALRSDAEPELRLTAFLYEQVFGHQATLVTVGCRRADPLRRGPGTASPWPSP